MSSSPSRPRLSTLATDHLAHGRARDERPAPSAADDERAIAAIAGAIATKAKARQRRRVYVWASAGLAAAAAIALTLSVAPWRSKSAPATATAAAPFASTTRLAGSVTVAHGALGDESIALEPRSIKAGDRIVVGAEGKASLDLSTGTKLTIDALSDFGVTSIGNEQRFLLRSGAVDAHVAKLHAGERFIVHTSDVEVEVRGTSFRVESNHPPCEGTRTRVIVTEGIVAVRRAAAAPGAEPEAMVGAGAVWPTGCVAVPVANHSPPVIKPNVVVSSEPPSEPKTSAASTHVTSAIATPAPRAVSHGSPSAARSATASDNGSSNVASSNAAGSNATSSSDLIEQNRLFGEATALRKRGANEAAVTAYERFLTRYPTSQLSESAAVERMRLLVAIDRSQRGAAAAREYLARFPRGFARREALEAAGEGGAAKSP